MGNYFTPQEITEIKNIPLNLSVEEKYGKFGVKLAYVLESGENSQSHINLSM